MNKTDKFKHFYVAENKLCNPQWQYVFHIAEPRLMIKYNPDQIYKADYDKFIKVVEVQWLDGAEPTNADEILTRAYNFLALDERLLDMDIEDFENDVDWKNL